MEIRTTLLVLVLGLFLLTSVLPYFIFVRGMVRQPRGVLTHIPPQAFDWFVKLTLTTCSISGFLIVVVLSTTFGMGAGIAVVAATTFILAFLILVGPKAQQPKGESRPRSNEPHDELGQLTVVLAPRDELADKLATALHRVIKRHPRQTLPIHIFRPLGKNESFLARTVLGRVLGRFYFSTQEVVFGFGGKVYLAQPIKDIDNLLDEVPAERPSIILITRVNTFNPSTTGKVLDRLADEGHEVIVGLDPEWDKETVNPILSLVAYADRLVSSPRRPGAKGKTIAYFGSAVSGKTTRLDLQSQIMAKAGVSHTYLSFDRPRETRSGTRPGIDTIIVMLVQQTATDPGVQSSGEQIERLTSSVGGKRIILDEVEKAPIGLLIPLLESTRRNGVRVWIAGYNLDYKGVPQSFVSVACRADRVLLTHGVCARCALEQHGKKTVRGTRTGVFLAAGGTTENDFLPGYVVPAADADLHNIPKTFKCLCRRCHYLYRRIMTQETGKE